MKSYTVYVHIFPNGKRYVGITKTKPEYRWNNGRGYKGCVVENAIRKFGWHNVEHKILYVNLSKEEAEDMEKQLIKEWDTLVGHKGYNVETGGNANKEISKETREKLSKANKGQVPWIKGRKHTKESNEKNRQAHLGKPPTVIKPVICLDTGVIYPSVTEAGRQLGLNMTHISSCCTGKRNFCGGFRWAHYKGGDAE